MAFLRTITDGHSSHHTMNVLEIHIQFLLGSVEDCPRSISEGLATSLATESLMTTLGVTALADIKQTTMYAADFLIREAVLG